MKTLEYFIEDTLNQLLEEALETKSGIENEFDKGKLFGYYETISKLMSQLEAFGLSELAPERVRYYNLESLIE